MQLVWHKTNYLIGFTRKALCCSFNWQGCLMLQCVQASPGGARSTMACAMLARLTLSKRSLVVFKFYNHQGSQSLRKREHADIWSFNHEKQYVKFVESGCQIPERDLEWEHTSDEYSTDGDLDSQLLRRILWIRSRYLASGNSLVLITKIKASRISASFKRLGHYRGIYHGFPLSQLPSWIDAEQWQSSLWFSNFCRQQNWNI